ncbi:MAG: class I SAM-dependent methyltransferase [Nanobdellota archaeon]
MFSNFVEKQTRKFQDIQIKKTFDILKFYNKNDKLKVLDLGCNDGYITYKLKNYLDCVKGMDIKNILKYKISYVQGEFLSYKFQESFDLIVCYSFLHHFENIEKIIKKCYKLLKENGVLIIFECNPYNPFTKLYAKENRDELKLHKPQEVLTFYKKYGFKKLKKEYILLSPFKLLSEYERFICKVPLGTKYFISGQKISKK